MDVERDSTLRDERGVADASASPVGEGTEGGIGGSVSHPHEAETDTVNSTAKRNGNTRRRLLRLPNKILMNSTTFIRHRGSSSKGVTEDREPVISHTITGYWGRADEITYLNA